MITIINGIVINPIIMKNNGKKPLSTNIFTIMVMKASINIQTDETKMVFL